MEKYQWYEVVDEREPLLQGDFVDSCPVIVPPTGIESEKVSVEVIEYDVVIMSQSCDLLQKKLDLVLVCPICLLSEFENISDIFRSRKGKEALRRGNVPGYHLLHSCEMEGFEKEYSVVDFRNVYSVPFSLL